MYFVSFVVKNYYLSFLGIIQRHWAAMTLLAFGLFFFSFEMLGLSLSHFPGDLGDGRFNLYILEHGFRYITGKVDSYWSAPFMVPEESVISYSDNLLGSLPIYAFFRGLGLERFTAYQYWYLAIVILNFLAAYIFCFSLLKQPHAAALGAFVFAFSIALQSQMTHAQTFPRYAIPLIFLFLVRFLEKKESKFLAFALLAWVYQVYCGIYLGFLCLIPIGVFIAFGVGSNYREWLDKAKIRPWLVTVLTYIISSILSLLPLLIPYIQRSSVSGFNSKIVIFKNIPTLNSFIYSHPGNIFWSGLSNNIVNAENWWDFQLFPGALALISFVMIVVLYIFGPKLSAGVRIKAPSFNLICITAICTILICIRVGPVSIYSIIYNLPGFGAIRAVQRIINIELIFFAFALAYLSHLLFIRYKSLRIVLFLALATLLFFDNYVPSTFSYKTSKMLALEREVGLIEKIDTLQEGMLLAYEPDSLIEPYFLYNLDVMMVSQRKDHSCVNAYTGNSPSAFNSYWTEPNEVNRKKWFDHENYNPKNLFIIH